MKKSYLMLAIATTLLMSSCVSKKKLAEAQNDLEKCQKQKTELTTDYKVAQSQLAAAQDRVTSLEQALAQQKEQTAAVQKSLDQSLTNANDNTANIAKLVDQINESNQYIRHLVEMKSKSDSLNLILTNNLTRSLSKEELKDVDVQVLKGVVYISLSDNMLYESGSYKISDRAAET